MDLDWYNITTLQPLPNTPIFDSMIAQGLISSVSFDEIRYNSGSYGKQREKAEINKDLLSGEFKHAFSNIDLDGPLREELDDVWAYMNYHLNFKRLFSEKRPKKLTNSWPTCRTLQTWSHLRVRLLWMVATCNLGCMAKSSPPLLHASESA